MTVEIRGDLSLESRTRIWRLLEWERSQEGKNLGVAEEDSWMEGSSGRKMTSRKLDVTEAICGGSCLREAECGGRSELDSGECGFLGGSSQYQGHVSLSY